MLESQKNSNKYLSSLARTKVLFYYKPSKPKTCENSDVVICFFRNLFL